ncbi:MAG TPA: hypothetical protein PKZ24_06435 [Nitrospirales bacterium]|nr:hypothetical protein [Nitrospirales bacterium]
MGQYGQAGIDAGVGPSITLLLFDSIGFLLQAVVPQRLVNWMEFAVGVMLVGLGCDVLGKITKSRLHIHVQRHSPQSPHFHAHSHRKESDHSTTAHQHTHSTAFLYRALFVGLMRGMAGSAALIVLTFQ